MRPLLLRALVAAGILVNVAFLLINLRPERPHLAHRTKARILLRASPRRAEWVKTALLAELGVERDVDFEVIPAKDFTEVRERVLAERDHPTGLLLADMTDEWADDLRRAKAVRPIDAGAEPAELAQAVTEYLPDALERARADGRLWFLPKRALIDVAVWLRPAVEDAFLHWGPDRPAIEAALREANGRGLPAGYQLEKDPERWDDYDLFVAAWYWAHHPVRWTNRERTLAKAAPRLAFRTGLNEDAVDDLFGALYRHGFKDKELGDLEAQAVVDTLQWDALFRKHHLLAPACEAKGGCDGYAVNSLLARRDIAWAPIDQADSLWLHGGSRRDADGGMWDPGDIEWSTIPGGSSVELDSRGEPARTGKSFSLMEVHLWTVPIHSPRPRLAWEVARFLTQPGPHQRETEAQGLLPVRVDISEQYPILFRLEWMQQMLDASYRQSQTGTGDLPDEVSDKGFDRVYTDLREHVLTRTPLPVTPAQVRAAIASFRPVEVSHGQ